MIIPLGSKQLGAQGRFCYLGSPDFQFNVPPDGIHCFVPLHSETNASSQFFVVSKFTVVSYIC